MTIEPRYLKDHFAGGGKAINGWCAIPSPVTAEIIARHGYDMITVDLQHGLLDYQTALTMLQAVGGFGMPAFCRVPWNEPGIIMKALDAGFTGIICPMVNTRTDAEQFGGACHYTPLGFRSFGPTRALQVHGADYANSARQLVAAVAMIETAEALENLDEILGVASIDGVYIGPADLALSLGYSPSLLPKDAPVLAAIETIRVKTKKAGKIAGIHCGSPDMTADMLRRGFDFASLLTDVRIFTTAVAKQLSRARGGSATTAQGQY